jgi:hypothetical protein
MATIDTMLGVHQAGEQLAQPFRTKTCGSLVKLAEFICFHYP